jgi:hypothetical protein
MVVFFLTPGRKTPKRDNSKKKQKNLARGNYGEIQLSKPSAATNPEYY